LLEDLVIMHIYQMNDPDCFGDYHQSAVQDYLAHPAGAGHARA
jgi:hypothetical protein